MRKCDIEKIAKKVKQKLEEIGEINKRHSGNYHLAFWKNILDPIFDYYRIGIYDRGSLGNAVIQEINSEIRMKSEKREPQLIPKNNFKMEPDSEIKLDMEKIERDARKALPSEIGDVSEEKLWKISDGQYGPKPKHFKKCLGNNVNQSQKKSDTWSLFDDEKKEKKKSETAFPPQSFR